MVVRLRTVNAKPQYYNVQKCRFLQNYSACAEVSSSVKLQLIDAANIVIALQNRCIAAAIRVG